MTDPEIDLAAIEKERDRIRSTYVRQAGERPGSSARGLHHVAFLSSDVERTVRFYQELFGAYPYERLTVAEIPLFPGGYGSTTLVMLTSASWDTASTTTATRR